MLQEIILIVHVVVALVVIGLVLLQHGKGADMGAAFGSGSAGSLFGATGASNFLSRSTAVLATVFFMTSMALTYFSTPRSQSGVMQRVEQPAKIEPLIPATTLPVAPAVPAEVPTATPKNDDTKSKDIPK